MTGSTDETNGLAYAEWRRALEDERLLGLECSGCSWITATPKQACFNCGSRDLTPIELGTTGELYSETTINVPPEGFDGSYRVGIVDLGGAKIMTRIEGDAEIGAEVTLAGVLETGDEPAPIFE